MQWRNVLVLVVCLVFAGFAIAAPTEEQVKAATARGVAWLVTQQAPEGCWSCGFFDAEALTAFALLKLEHHALDSKYGLGLPSPFDDRNPYKQNIINGLNWLLARGSAMAIGPQPAGNPDTNGDGLGAYFGLDHHRNYASSLVLSAVCLAGAPDRVVAGGNLNGWTYAKVSENLMNYLAFGQNEPAPYRGGWGYFDNMPWSDNSNSGYVSLGLAYYESARPMGCGLPVPQFVKTEMNVWIDYIQADILGNPNDGGSGYADPNNWVNVLKTGNLIQQMAFVGDAPAAQRVKDAINYLVRHWGDPNSNPGWNQPGVADYQATFTIMKGLTAFQIPKIGPAPEIDWAADFETAIVAQQPATGNWPCTNWDGSKNCMLSTVWALLTLERAAPIIAIPAPVDVKPGSCPNPFNVKQKGVTPVAILGTADFDVRKVDPASVKLETVPPLRWAYEDVGTPFPPFIGKPKNANACTTRTADGKLDIIFHFDSPALAALMAGASDREVVVLKVTGKLKLEFGGTSIIGEDVVLLLVK